MAIKSYSLHGVGYAKQITANIMPILSVAQNTLNISSTEMLSFVLLLQASSLFASRILKLGKIRSK